ncbi:putative reverse transcriptase domain-containing protein [Tanacetum coccineum]
MSAPNEGTVLSRAFGLNNSGLTGPTSYAKLVTKEPSMKSVNFRTLLAPAGNRADVVISLESVRAVSERFANTLYVESRCELIKEDFGNVPVWVKFHGVPMTTFSEDGLSAIATKLGNPLKLDSYTSDMCMQSCSRLSYAKAMIEVQASVELKDVIVVGPKVDFKPTKQFYKLVSNKNSANTSGKKKQVKLSRQEVSNSNLFDTLNSVEKDDDLDTNGRNSKSVGKGYLTVAPGSSNTTLIAERIDKLERHILDGKLMFVDDDEKPIYKVDSTVNADSDSEVKEVYNKTIGFVASTSLKSGSESRYDTKSLLEQ